MARETRVRDKASPSGSSNAPRSRRSLADLVDADRPEAETEAAAVIEPVVEGADRAGFSLEIDDTKAAVAGIRRLQGEHLVLYTDVPQQPAVDELPQVFDQAVPLWCRYFGVDLADVRDWQVTGFLMQEQRRFQATGMHPDDLPPFPNGYQRGDCLWVHDQSTDFYRRHLLLHEGTHAFMDRILGGTGPPWYAEGMAELLGTHRWSGGRLELGVTPRSKEEAEGWGRIRIIKDELAAGRGMMPDSILDYGSRSHLQNEPYGWCWGLAALLDAHPRFQERFRQLPARLLSQDVTPWFRQQCGGDWQELCEEWQVFVMGLEYGYDVPRAAIERRFGEPLPAEGAAVSIRADRGWQSSGVRLEAATEYEIQATGRYRVAETTAPWECEPGGVTIRYYRGQPLGMLVGAIRDDPQPLAGLSPLTRPQPIGLRAVWTPPRSGTLYLKINESPAELADNAGQLDLLIRVTAPRP